MNISFINPKSGHIFCLSGSLDDFLFRRDVNIPIERKIEIVKGIARGVLHLHKHNIVHRDLAARNVLLNQNGEPKVTVFAQ